MAWELMMSDESVGSGTAEEPDAAGTLLPGAEPEPSGEPTAEPTAEPTGEPTAEPAAEPTADPGAERAGEPAGQRAGEPAAEPAAQPTAEPVDEPAEPAVAASVANPVKPKGRIRRFWDAIPIPHPRTKRAWFMWTLVLAGAGSIITMAGFTAIGWTETQGFCGRCHTMSPELKAYAASPHREVTCAECHVEPGVQGWVKAKIKGTQQLVEVVTGTFPEPIPPPDHSDLPPVADTCLKCHSLEQISENSGPVKIVIRPEYREDEKNTRETVAVMLRPAGVGNTSMRGAHWHVQEQVTYRSKDVRAQTIDLVEFKETDGSISQFIARDEIGVAEDVRPDIVRIKATERERKMDCLDCHNRVGHGAQSPEKAIDQAMSAGAINADLPYIKRDGLALVMGDYASTAKADAAIAGLRDSYARLYPGVVRTNSADIEKAISELQKIYEATATPEMKVTAATYPNNLGHQTAPGCFRCHDGSHVKVVDGKVTDEEIPSACSTCHTFPQIGSNVSGFLLGTQPDDHKDPLWVFGHKTTVTSAAVAQAKCATCHPSTYCENCHNSGASKVDHDQMLYNHPASIKKSGAQACAYCHQPVYCAQCHKGNVLGTGEGSGGGTTGALPTP